MSRDRIIELLQEIEQTACVTVATLEEAAANLLTIKTAASEALRQQPAGAVKEIIEAIKALACETYQSLLVAEAALQSIKTSAGLAIGLLS